jgi:hypothetical protein
MTSIVEALSAVMEDVGAVRKGERNSQQGFNFRGIDAVVKAVYPALLRHKVIVTPSLLSYVYESVEVGAKRTPMGHARVTVEYRFTGPEGDSVVAAVAAEAMDSGDKATAKAMSVAMRTALLQALCLPTDEPDPDATSYERAPREAPKRAATQRDEPQPEPEPTTQGDEGLMATIRAAKTRDALTALVDTIAAQADPGPYQKAARERWGKVR